MKTKFIKSTGYTLLTMLALLSAGCAENEIINDGFEDKTQIEQSVVNPETTEAVKVESDLIVEASQENKENKDDQVALGSEVDQDNHSVEGPDTVNYKLITVDGGDTSGYRQPNVVVNIGHGNDREYWAYTNEHGQLIRVTAKEITLQNDAVEDVTSSGRYYSAMANVPGVGEKYGMDRGHVIADSLGGVSNAYNITPQDATLNRHGDQAYMERNIRDAGGATNFDAIITYPDTETQTPTHYSITYTIKGTTVTDEFDNGNPDERNAELGLTGKATVAGKEIIIKTKPKSTPKTETETTTKVETSSENTGNVSVGDTAAVDTNGNGKITITEAKAAGFSMPIAKGHWLYEHMDDRNGDGLVGE